MFGLGPETSKIYADIIRKAKTVVWNGLWEYLKLVLSPSGTYAVAKALTESEGVTIVGGGAKCFGC